MAKILGGQVGEYTINTEQLSNTAVAAFAKSLTPKIQYANVASNTYTILDDTAVNVGGGYIVITGADFQSGATVLVDTTLASSVTYVTSNTIQAQVPAKSAASYNLYVINPDGGIGIKVSGITYSGSPTWVTTSPLANVTSNTVFSGNVSATGASSYSNTSVLPTGFNLLANGYYYGNISVSSSTTYNFTIRATDAELQDSDKTFSLTTIMPPTYTVEYLVVAGGGSGGASTGAGGGAGGLLYGSTVVNSGNVLSIVVGAGGSGVTGDGTASNDGNLSSFGNINAVGGGGGGSYTSSPFGTVHNGRPGGSGGGTSIRVSVTGGTVGEGTPGQGFPGGNWQYNPTNGAARGMGGGGGATEAGKQGINNPSFGGLTAGAGGAGYTWTFTGITYAGGGGGAASAPNPNAPYTNNGGAGGSGGGGAGGVFHSVDPGSSTNGSSGTTNRGGGGGGGTSGTSGSGGSGVVILAIPTPSYPGSAPGATVTTPPAAPGKTVLTFTSSGTYTA